MKNFDNEWQRLVAAARRAPRTADESAPYGFATRVASRAWDGARSGPSVFARMSLRAAVVAGLLAAAAVGVNYSAITSAFDDEPTVSPGDDPVADVVNLGT